MDSITDLMDMDLSKLQEIMKNKGTWCAAEHEVTESDNLVTEQPPPPMFFVAKTWFYIYICMYVNQFLTKCGSLEKGMANHFSILALRTPGTV